MKKRILNLVVLFALLVTPLAVTVAAVATTGLKANIPFDFAVGNKSMPAGSYHITSTSTAGLMKVSNYEKKASAIFITNDVRGVKVSKGSRLDFRRYGNRYFLGRIWTKGMQTSQEIPRSRTERKAADEAKFLAGHLVEPEIVTVECQ